MKTTILMAQLAQQLGVSIRVKTCSSTGQEIIILKDGDVTLPPHYDSDTALAFLNGLDYGRKTA